MKKYKLGEIGILSRGKSKHRPRNDKILYGGKYPFVQTSDIKNADHILRTYSQTYNETGLKQSKLWRKNTICITIAANIAESAILGFDACFPDSVLGLVVDDKIADYHYIEYLLQHYKKTIQNQSNGTSQENINLSTFDEVYFEIPPLKEQQKIGRILSSIDDKIAINNQINELLECTARAIYEYYFVQFDFPDKQGQPYKSSGGAMRFDSTLNRPIPKDFEVKNLLDIIEWTSGAQPPKSTFIYEYKEGYVRFIQNRDYQSNSHITYIKDSTKNKICNEFDIMMDKYGEAGKVRFGLSGAYNVAMSKISVKIDNTQEYVRKFLEQESIVNYLKNACMASTRASLNETHLENLYIVIPDKETLKEFEKMQKQYIKTILHIKLQNQKLKNLRDFLLPLLINAQVQI